MSVALRLTSEQFSFYAQILTKAKIEVDGRGPVAIVTAETYKPILDALIKAHSYSLNLKTKNITHMERLFHIQTVIARFHDLAPQFEQPAPVEAEEELA